MNGSASVGYVSEASQEGCILRALEKCTSSFPLNTQGNELVQSILFVGFRRSPVIEVTQDCYSLKMFLCKDFRQQQNKPKFRLLRLPPVLRMSF